MQAAASCMENTATRVARELGVPSRTLRIPWGSRPFPSANKIDEKVAREARYNRLFVGMHQSRADVIAFAHHADDQVETAIMRMTQGSGVKGLAGMRPVRRWGMGKRQNEYYRFGIEGMHKWIVRPLLDVPKDRLLATCEANKLDYVNDPTNFQPDLTFRNSVRQILSGEEPAVPQEPSPGSPDVNVQTCVAKLRGMAPDVRPADQLREAVRRYGIRLEELESQVTGILARSTMPSPPSTLLLKSAPLAEITDEEARITLVRRALRYTSYGPWGAVWSEAHGDRNVLRRVVSHIWPSTPPHSPSKVGARAGTGLADDSRRTFSAGAGVVVYPVAIQKDEGTIRWRAAVSGEDSEVPGWIFARMPPHQKAIALPDAYARLDVTDALLAALAAGRHVYATLYDCRFTVRFYLDRRGLEAFEEELRGEGARIVVEADTRWVLPQVVLRRKSGDDQCLAKFVWDLKGWKDRRAKPLRQQGWIKMEFVRTLDAI
ncbi:PP-loop family-domain-containing protein [Trametes meyenii]|nr:PP-loop family-domain-containing protein [Trametes meyenii]